MGFFGELGNLISNTFGAPVKTANRVSGNLDANKQIGMIQELRENGMNPTWNGADGGSNSSQPVDSGEGLGNSEIQKHTGNSYLNRAQRSAIQFDMLNKKLDLERKQLENKHLRQYMAKGFDKRVV